MPLEGPEDRGVAVDAVEPPRGREHARSPARPVHAIDPKHAGVERFDPRHLDPVGAREMGAELGAVGDGSWDGFPVGSR
jgi:hypothetical protein